MLPCVMLLIGIIYISVWYFIDSLITKKRIKENQIAWNEYCKDKTLEQAYDLFLPWLDSRKIEMGWNFYYFPNFLEGVKDK